MKSKLSQILIAGATAAVLLAIESYPAISPVLALYTIVNNILEQKQFKAHQGSISSVSFSPDGKLLATAGDDGTVNLLRVAQN